MEGGDVSADSIDTAMNNYTLVETITDAEKIIVKGKKLLSFGDLKTLIQTAFTSIFQSKKADTELYVDETEKALIATISDKINRSETLTAVEIQLLITNLIDSSPEFLNTLNELSNAIANDPNFATTMATELSKKVTAIVGYSLTKNDLTDLLKAAYDDAVTAIPNKAIKTTQVTELTLTAANWTLVSGLYEYNLANVNITALNFVEVIPDNATIEITKSAQLLPTNVSSAGSVKIYATNLPTGDIVVTINIYE